MRKTLCISAWGSLDCVPLTGSEVGFFLFFLSLKKKNSTFLSDSYWKITSIVQKEQYAIDSKDRVRREGGRVCRSREWDLPAAKALPIRNIAILLLWICFLSKGRTSQNSVGVCQRGGH